MSELEREKKDDFSRMLAFDLIARQWRIHCVGFYLSAHNITGNEAYSQRPTLRARETIRSSWDVDCGQLCGVRWSGKILCLRCASFICLRYGLVFRGLCPSLLHMLSSTHVHVVYPWIHALLRSMSFLRVIWIPKAARKYLEEELDEQLFCALAPRLSRFWPEKVKSERFFVNEVDRWN